MQQHHRAPRTAPRSARILIAALALSTAALAAPPALAGENAVMPHSQVFIPPGVLGGGVSGGGAEPEATTTAQTASPAATAQVVNALSQATQFCARLGIVEYRVDCLSERIQQVSKGMPTTGDYAEARAALDKTWRDLKTLAETNRSRSRRPARARSPGPDATQTSRPLVPVDTARIAEVNRQAVAIIEEAETVLLRATESSEQRRVAYQQIAEVVGSNKVLLRAV